MHRLFRGSSRPTGYGGVGQEEGEDSYFIRGTKIQLTLNWRCPMA